MLKICWFLLLKYIVICLQKCMMLVAKVCDFGRFCTVWKTLPRVRSSRVTDRRPRGDQTPTPTRVAAEMDPWRPQSSCIHYR